MSLGDQIKTFIKKYGGRILYYLLFFFVILYLDKHQDKFYLKSDVENAIPIIHLTYGLILTILLLIIIIRNFRTRMSPRAFLLGGFLCTIAFAFFYLLSIDFFSDVVLFVNRKFGTDIIERTYIVGYFNSGNNNKHEFTLVNTKNKELIYDGRLIDSVNASSFIEKDTLLINFTKGLFGVNYYNGAIIHKLN